MPHPSMAPVCLGWSRRFYVQKIAHCELILRYKLGFDRLPAPPSFQLITVLNCVLFQFCTLELFRSGAGTSKLP